MNRVRRFLPTPARHTDSPRPLDKCCTCIICKRDGRNETTQQCSLPTEVYTGQTRLFFCLAPRRVGQGQSTVIMMLLQLSKLDSLAWRVPRLLLVGHERGTGSMTASLCDLHEARS